MTKYRCAAAVVVFLGLVIPFLYTMPACAQGRLSDKDLEQRIKNMNDDVKRFRSAFNSSVSKTSIRKTTQEKDAKTLVQNFQRETNSLYQKFKKTKKPDPYLQNCLNMSSQIDTVLGSTTFDPATTAQWAKIKTQLKDIATAFNLPG